MNRVLQDTRRLLETVRHLHPEQVRAQAVHHGQRLFSGSERWDVARESVDGARLRRLGRRPVLFPGDNDPESMLSGTFSFVGRSESVGWLPRTWEVDAAGTLWNYNLHYFDWIWGLEPRDARAVVSDWIDRCGARDFSKVAFDPYPTSLRLGNWSRYFASTGQSVLDSGFEARLSGTLIAQMDWLARNLETRLLANHYFENAAALVMAGSLVEHPGARQARGRGMAILKRELAEQFPPDGVHFERSPMYHVRMTQVLGFLCDLEDDEVSQLVAPVLNRALNALEKLIHPDGDIALLNDSAFGVYSSGADLTGERRPAPGAFALPDAGYFGYRGTEGHYVVADYGALGPDYNLGHAHGDVFSFELSLGGKRVITDTGVRTYEDGTERAVSRSTRAHNTVEIDGEDQAEFWSRHRVGRRPKVEITRWEPTPDGFAIDGWHDGYRGRRSSAIHSRAMKFDRAGTLTITDRIAGRKACTARSFLHFDPRMRLRPEGTRGFVGFCDGERVIRVEFAGDGGVDLGHSPYFPRFGTAIDRPCLMATFPEGGHQTTRLDWKV